MDTSSEQESLIEGEDYYFENGLMVLTALYHLCRGYCCDHGCRHCPFVDSRKELQRNVRHEENQA
jgi:hypothetical protein